MQEAAYKVLVGLMLKLRYLKLNGLLKLYVLGITLPQSLPSAQLVALKLFSKTQGHEVHERGWIVTSTCIGVEITIARQRQILGITENRPCIIEL